jgi:hypothetical protein
VTGIMPVATFGACKSSELVLFGKASLSLGLLGVSGLTAYMGLCGGLCRRTPSSETFALELVVFTTLLCGSIARVNAIYSVAFVTLCLEGPAL